METRRRPRSRRATEREGGVKGLERDCLISLHSWLWKHKDRLNRETTPPFPETIIYEYHFPRAWYIYNHKAGGDKTPKITKLAAKECGTTAIYEAFTSDQLPNVDVVAEFRWRNNKDELVVEHLGRKALYNFLTTPPEKGILQKFIPPYGLSNEGIIMTWTPFLCFVERWQNVHVLTDPHVPILDRAVTGNSVHCKEVLCAPYIFSRMKQYCNALDAAYLQVEKQPLKRIIAQFKLDVNMTVWLVSCSVLEIGMERQKRDPVPTAPGAFKINDPQLLSRFKLSALKNHPCTIRTKTKSGLSVSGAITTATSAQKWKKLMPRNSLESGDVSDEDSQSGRSGRRLSQSFMSQSPNSQLHSQTNTGSEDDNDDSDYDTTLDSPRTTAPSLIITPSELMNTSLEQDSAVKPKKRLTAQQATYKRLHQSPGSAAPIYDLNSPPRKGLIESQKSAKKRKMVSKDFLRFRRLNDRSGGPDDTLLLLAKQMGLDVDQKFVQIPELSKSKKKINRFGLDYSTKDPLTKPRDKDDLLALPSMESDDKWLQDVHPDDKGYFDEMMVRRAKFEEGMKENVYHAYSHFLNSADGQHFHFDIATDTCPVGMVRFMKTLGITCKRRNQYAVANAHLMPLVTLVGLIKGLIIKGRELFDEEKHRLVNEVSAVSRWSGSPEASEVCVEDLVQANQSFEMLDLDQDALENSMQDDLTRMMDSFLLCENESRVKESVTRVKAQGVL